MVFTSASPDPNEFKPMTMKRVLIIFAIFFEFALCGYSQPKTTSSWIWYPGDLEVWLHTEVGSRRQERGQPYPPFWRIDSPYGVVVFEKTVDLAEPESIRIFSDGRFRLSLNGSIAYNFDPMNVKLPAGKTGIEILVENFKTFPSLWVQGKTINSDATWQVTNQDKAYYPAATGKFTDPHTPPSTFQLAYTPIKPTVIQSRNQTLLVDFGKETFGKVVVENLKGKGQLKLYYGESKQEALAETLAETFDYLDVKRGLPSNDTTETRAFRYIYAVWDAGISFDRLSALYEYLPLEAKGEFSCSDTLINHIYEVSLYTLQLATREFHLDGIKRDRWAWSGDAYQSYLMNFYTFFDEDVNKRTLYALRGHDPVKTHINTILDYSFYWMIGIYDHFLYTGDTAFVKQIYPRMKTLMEFCLGRTNSSGFVEGLPGDWVFIDWAPMSKAGEISFEQLLFSRSLQSMAQSAEIAGDRDFADKCDNLSKDLKKKIFDVFWSDKQNAFVHNRVNGKLSDEVTRYANMFAILFDYVDAEKKQQIKDHVILNEEILKITTPYMKFYELASLCEIGEEEKVIEFVKEYWGGMLKLGATTIWEAYDPAQSGDEHYAMYGRPFGKSLCHAWGANPVYLFGKYLLGVKPTAPGYLSYQVEPSLGGLEWIKGQVPTPHGNIEVYMDQGKLIVKSIAGAGLIRLKSKTPPKVEKGVVMRNVGGNRYEIELSDPSRVYTVRYSGAEISTR